MQTPVAHDTMDMWNFEEYEDLICNEDSFCATCALSVIATYINSKYKCKNTLSTEMPVFWLCSVNERRIRS